jgi:hypothetical protein
MRAVFRGVTYRLNEISKASQHMLLNDTRLMSSLDHLGSVTKHELGRCSTPQVYHSKKTETLYAAVVREANFINEVWIMRPYDLKTVPVPTL